MVLMVLYENVIIRVVCFPDAPKISVRVTNTQSQGDTVKVNEGNRVNMTCSVDANPPITGRHEWVQGDEVLHQGAHYVTASVIRSQTGNYSCRAQNTLLPSGRPILTQVGSKRLELIVQCEYTIYTL